MCKEKSENSSAKDYFEQYWRYCSSLRNWFVAYGIGGCVLFISDKAQIFQKLSINVKATVVISFIIGVAAQVILAFLNKWIHWCIYRGEDDEDFSKGRWCKYAESLSSCFLIDLVIDLITFFAFGVATVALFVGVLLQSSTCS